MRKERLQEFTVRITQANQSGLVVIMYEIIEADIEYAKELLADAEVKGFRKECHHAQRILNELMGTLDYHYPISYELLSLYSFCNKRIIKADMEKKDSYLDEVKLVIGKLKAAYAIVSKQDDSGPVMKNTQQLYAGLTYGKNALNESSLAYNDTKRGFMV